MHLVTVNIFLKGQLISKGLFGGYNSPKKRTKNVCPIRLGPKFEFSSSFFFLRIEIWNFEINWPLVGSLKMKTPNFTLTRMLEIPILFNFELLTYYFTYILLNIRRERIFAQVWWGFADFKQYTYFLQVSRVIFPVMTDHLIKSFEAGSR